MKNKYNLSKEEFLKEELLNEKNKYDCVITGSDQVWNISIVGELSDIYTLNFGLNNFKKISYAASIGDSSLIEKNKELYKIVDNLDMVTNEKYYTVTQTWNFDFT